jgi:predicted GIY-YIG superfamily endonuclease
MARHEAGKASRYTASLLPMADSTAARREESRIKLLTRADKLELIATQESC